MMEATLAESTGKTLAIGAAKKKKKAGTSKKKTTKASTKKESTLAAKKENPFVFKSTFTQKTLDQIHLEAGSVTDTLSSLQEQLIHTAEMINNAQNYIKHKNELDNPNKNEMNKISQTLDPAHHIFATMLTDDGYLPGVQLLHYSMEKHINSYLKNMDENK